MSFQNLPQGILKKEKRKTPLKSKKTDRSPRFYFSLYPNTDRLLFPLQNSCSFVILFVGQD